jgi:hypothetical protein
MLQRININKPVSANLSGDNLPFPGELRDVIMRIASLLGSVSDALQLSSIDV